MPPPNFTFHLPNFTTVNSCSFFVSFKLCDNAQSRHVRGPGGLREWIVFSDAAELAESN